jgi:hypothetical protein
VRGKVQPHLGDPDWDRLLGVEERLEAEIVVAEAEAKERIARARAAAASAMPDPDAIAALLAAEERDAVERQLARIEQETTAAVRRLTDAPQPVIDELAQLALDAVLGEGLPADRP